MNTFLYKKSSTFLYIAEVYSFFLKVGFKLIKYLGPVLTILTSTKNPNLHSDDSLEKGRQGEERGLEGKRQGLANAKIKATAFPSFLSSATCFQIHFP